MKNFNRKKALKNVIKRIKRKDWLVAKKIIVDHDLLTHPDFKITLCDLLYYLKKKFKLKALTQRELMLIGMWRYNYNDLRKQRNYCIEYVYYLVNVIIPKPKKDGKK
jgi:hypothetical protein